MNPSNAEKENGEIRRTGLVAYRDGHGRAHVGDRELERRVVLAGRDPYDVARFFGPFAQRWGEAVCPLVTRVPVVDVHQVLADGILQRHGSEVRIDQLVRFRSRAQPKLANVKLVDFAGRREYRVRSRVAQQLVLVQGRSVSSGSWCLWPTAATGRRPGRGRISSTTTNSIDNERLLLLLLLIYILLLLLLLLLSMMMDTIVILLLHDSRIYYIIVGIGD